MTEGRLGDSVIKRLPSAQVMIPARVLGLSPALGSLLSRKAASPSPTPPACVPSLALKNK